MSARTAVAIAWATAVWIALWGSPSFANVLAGVAIGVATVLLVPVSSGQAEGEVTRRVRVRPLAALAFLGYFVRALVVASAVVAWEVVTPQNRIHQGIIRLPLRTDSRGLATLIGNAISLTPGTVTIEVSESPLTLYVHVLHLNTVERVRADLRELEERALRAFQPEALQRSSLHPPTDPETSP